MKTQGMWIPVMSLYMYMWNAIACDVDDIEMRWWWCCWWYWNEMMLMLMKTLGWNNCWCGWWHWDEMILMLMITLRWDDVDVDVDDDIEMRWCWCWQCHWDECMLFMYMQGAMTCLNIPGEGMGFGLKIISVPEEGRVLFRILNYSRSMHWWCPCFILHNCVEIV